MKNLCKITILVIIFLGLVSLNTTVHADELILNEQLYGDILIGEDSEEEEIYQTEVDTNLSVTGKYYITKIKEKLEEDKNTVATLTKNKLDRVTLANTSSSFTATLTLPEGMEFSEEPTLDNVQFSGGNNIFELSDISVEGNTVTAVMSLKESYTKFTDLYDGINKVDDALIITVNNIKASQPGTYTLLGTIEGNLKTEVYYQYKQFNMKIMDVDYKWNGIQYPEGKDVVAQDDETIQFTLSIPEKEPDPEPEPEQEARIIDVNPPTYSLINASEDNTKGYKTSNYLLLTLITILAITLIYYFQKRKSIEK